MTLTVTYLQRQFKKFNKEFFNNELPDIEIKISRSKSLFGCFYWKNTKEGQIPQMITISGYYNQSGIQYSETLIHEMIHYYQCYKTLGVKESTHGYTFKKIMNEINKSQDIYRITIHADNNNLELKNKNSKVYNILVYTWRDHTYISRVSSKLTNPKYIEEHYNGVKVISINQTTNDLADKFNNCKSRIKMIPLTEEYIKEFNLKIA